MRFFCAICITILSINIVSAQHNYLSLLKDGKIWNCERSEFLSDGYELIDYSYKISGDTVINSEILKKLYIQDCIKYNDAQWHYYGGLKETDKSIFILYANQTEAQLLYDFTIQEGGSHDVIVDGYKHTRVCHSITTENIYGTERDYIKFNFVYEEDGEEIIPTCTFDCIEGIGAVSDPFTITWQECGEMGVKSCIEDGIVIYTPDWESQGSTKYRTLVREGVKWKCRMDVVSAITETESYPYTIELKGDTIINDVSYKKCYYTFEDASVASNDIPRAFLREDIGKKQVYALYNYNYTTTLPFDLLDGYFEPSTEGLLYDFNDLANTNQGWHEFKRKGEEGITAEVIMLNSKEYIKTTFNNIYVFIEGIGFVEFKDLDYEGDLLFPTMPRLASAFSPEALPIFCSFEDETGKVIYTSEYAGVENLVQDSNNISIEICNNNINIIANQSLISVKIINMAGMVVIDDVTSKENTITILTDKYHSGCYIIQVSTENNIATKKIIL